MNTERMERIKKTVMVDHYPICIEKFRITLDVREHTRNDSVIIQRGKILKACAERMPIAIGDDELIVGIASSKHMGLEIDPDYGIWPPALEAEGDRARRRRRLCPVRSGPGAEPGAAVRGV